MHVQEIMDYVMKTPHNTNPAILRQKLQEFSTGNEGIAAQADWAEINENSPSYIKNKPFVDMGAAGATNGSFILVDGNLSVQGSVEKLSCILPIEMPTTDAETFETVLSESYYADVDKAFQQGFNIYLKAKTETIEHLIQIFDLINSNNIFTLYGKIISDNLKEILVIVKIPQN